MPDVRSGGVAGDVDAVGELAKAEVRAHFLVEGFREEAGEVVLAELFGVGAGGAVGGDFVMFDALHGGGEACIHDFGVAAVADSLLDLMQQNTHGFAGFFVWGFVYPVQDSGEPFEVEA